MQSPDQIVSELHTIRDYIRWSISRMSEAGVYCGHGTDNIVDEASRLVLHSLGIPAEAELNLLDASLTRPERLALLQLLDQRVNERIPLPYLLGESWFAGMPFTVDQRVLIPRSPLAELIEQGFEPWLQQQPVSAILDLCTGSGCIGIACAHYFEEAEVDLADLSPVALEVAELNIQRYELQGRVRVVESDLFSALAGKRYQLIVSNPPYVDQQDLADMPAEYHHEPSIALGSGEDGLDLTRQILREASDYLTDDGILVVEVGNSGLALEQAFPAVAFTWLEFERGGHGVFAFTKAELQHYQPQFA
jgi:ribosomal protein L3 glutamine methyltransferase